MKWVAGLLVAAPWAWAANQAADRAAIDKVVASLNDQKAHADNGEVWTETSHPMIVIRSVQFMSSKAARVEASRVQYGSITMSSVPVVMLLEKKRGAWKITSSRDGDPTPVYPPIRIERPPQ